MAAPVPVSRSGAGEKDGTFASILVGIDETAESVVAAAQAGVLLEPGGSLPERMVHAAGCSVLVVQTPASPSA